MSDLIPFFFMLVIFTVLTSPLYFFMKYTMSIEQRGVDYNSSFWQFMTARSWGFIKTGRVNYVNSYILKSSLVYYRNRAGSRPKPFVIYKNLPVTKLGMGEEESVEIGTGYSELSPAMRGIYLKWLEDGRRGKSINIALLFIYLYGLEHRAVIEGKDLAGILGELRELYKIYKENSEFCRFVENLIAYIILKTHAFTDSDRLRLNYFIQDELPNSSPVYTSGAALKSLNYPLSRDWLFSYVSEKSEEPDATLPENFLPLFYEYYSFKANYIYEQVKYKIKVVELEQTLNYRLKEAPPVKELSLSIPEDRLTELFSIRQKCLAALKEYRERLGSAGELELFMLLPKFLQSKHPLTFAYRFDDVLTEEYSFFHTYGIDFDLQYNEEDHLYSYSDSVLFCRLSEQMGYAVEPDARLSERGYHKYEKVIFFKKQLQDTTESDSYKVVARLYDLAAFITSYYYGGEETASLQSIQKILAESFCANDAERERLDKRAQLGNSFYPVRKVEVPGKAELEKLGRLILMISNLDESPLPDKTEYLESVFSELEIDVEQIKSSPLSKGVTNTDELGSFLKKEPQTIRFIDSLITTDIDTMINDDDDDYSAGEPLKNENSKEGFLTEAEKEEALQYLEEHNGLTIDEESGSYEIDMDILEQYLKEKDRVNKLVKDSIAKLLKQKDEDSDK